MEWKKNFSERNNIMSGCGDEAKSKREENFIESYCVKITDIPIHLINQIKDQSVLATAEDS
jgi:hypothetical protein